MRLGPRAIAARRSGRWSRLIFWQSWVLELEMEAAFVHVLEHVHVEAWILIDHLVAAPADQVTHEDHLPTEVRKKRDTSSDPAPRDIPQRWPRSWARVQEGLPVAQE